MENGCNLLYFVLGGYVHSIIMYNILYNILNAYLHSLVCGFVMFYLFCGLLCIWVSFLFEIISHSSNS